MFQKKLVKLQHQSPAELTKLLRSHAPHLCTWANSTTKVTPREPHRARATALLFEPNVSCCLWRYWMWRRGGWCFSESPPCIAQYWAPVRTEQLAARVLGRRLTCRTRQFSRRASFTEKRRPHTFYLYCRQPFFWQKIMKVFVAVVALIGATVSATTSQVGPIFNSF